MKYKQQLLKRQSSIVANLVVSLSEITKVYPDFDPSSIKSYSGEYTDEFLHLLQGLGMDIEKPVRETENIHRNRLNEVVNCLKWSGDELTNDKWIESGYASRAAKDKAGGSFLIEESYRQRGETKEIQDSYDAKDKCSIIDESVWVKE